MNKIDQAREWAEHRRSISDTQLNAGVKAAAEIIQSLPDQWLDAGKVREIIEEMERLPDTTRVSSEIAIATEAWKRRLEALLPSKLPTLADMTEEEREACQWMQCKIDGHNDPQVLSKVGREYSWVLLRNGSNVLNRNEFITPLQGEPKLKLPGSSSDDVAYATGGVLTTQDVVDECRDVGKERALPRPEDVPADELWLVECGWTQWFAKRNRSWSMEFPWRLISMVRDSKIARDSEITLIHKLVPEQPALPEGMRLADHEEYGRVVVSPEMDSDNEYKAFYPDQEIRTGADWEYVHENNLTFLDGDEK